MEFSQEISDVIHSPTPTCSSEEDEDMAANCLILLARGGGSCLNTNMKQVGKTTGSRKFSEVSTATACGGGAKVGLFVYECKTCNRTFPSFQALGGHRASHKKPKLMDHHDHCDQPDDVKKQSPPPPQSPLSAAHVTTVGVVSNGSNKAKIHECSTCGAEFTSGQALGGHMRRHRPPVLSTTAGKSPVGGNDEARMGSTFSLDLNLPAPQEEDEAEENKNKFEFTAKQQTLVFSVPALVDCHY